ncbi:CmpA/NrtA family ABC transporter substrate-binding protein [Glaciimonas soli]|uniref:Nitrate ABC transporter substrate-binding protein n=1 Tax=Glaciimonas soli TaxID=2590999 RepID=A0A843YRE5_9BURK|nr:CmpA/NrtA family ABC transporter substrate-binding protein [Glaciimonas soli]MQQ99295.1 nitrate ABC transporter substrate-binding protein [Glaciimonas soli]
MTVHPNLDPSREFAKPERPHLRIGFVALTDCASLVAAKMMDFGQRNGLTLELCKQPSWAAVRDKLLSGELDAAQTLYGMVYGIQLGLGGPQADMAILMTLNRNGQAITVSNRLADALRSGSPLSAAFAMLGRKPVFAQTFPTGTHAMWLNYWLAAQGVHPLHDVESVVIPPPQMADALAQGELDGFCAGEPWHAVAEHNHSGRTIVSSSQIWPDHPEKALACRREFAALYPNTVQALVRTLLEASQWLENPPNKVTTSHRLASPEYLNIAQELILPRLSGEYGNSMLPSAPLPHRFFDANGMNYPLASDGLWFLSQFHRWGLLTTTEGWEKIVTKVCQTESYMLAAQSLGYFADEPATTAMPFIDGYNWDPTNPIAYSRRFAIQGNISG